MPETMSADAPQVPALPVTFRPTRTRVVLLTVGVAMFAVITAVALLLEKLSAGSGAASSSPRCSSSAYWPC